jgi:AP2-associated kinase
MNEKEAAEASIQKETTQMYRAPEMADIYMRDYLTEKTDVWALGCIFYALMFLKHPFQDKGNLAIMSGNYVIPNPSPVPPDAIEYLKRMLDVSILQLS